MGKVDSLLVTSFKGVDVRSQAHLRTERANLDTPRELINFHLDQNGHYFMPRADAEVIHDFTATNGPIIRMAWCFYGILIQTATGVYILDYETTGTDDATFPDPPELILTLDTQNVPIWVLTIGTEIFFGFTTRGALTPDGGTWKFEDDGVGGWTVTDISANDPLLGLVSTSVLFKGRRFIVGRQRTVYFSDLNDHETFGADSSFEISGDEGAIDFTESAGAIQGMIAWEDVLVFFMRNSIWMLTGSGPDTWNLRQVLTTIGNSAPWSLVRVEEGVLRFHQLRGDPGVYVFSGTVSQKISDPIDEYLQGFSPNLVPQGNPYSWQAATWTRRYYLAMQQADAEDIQILCYDLDTKQWTTFDGMAYSAIATDQNGLFFSAGNVVYRAADSDLLPRAPGRDGRIVLGYFDQDHMFGMGRFMALKVGAKFETLTTGTCSITVTANVPDAPSVSDTQSLDADTYGSLVFPIGLRGHAIEFEIDVVADDDVSVVIESLELVMSRKGEKVARV